MLGKTALVSSSTVPLRQGDKKLLPVMSFLHKIVISSQVPAASHFSTLEKLNCFSQTSLPEDR